MIPQNAAQQANEVNMWMLWAKWRTKAGISSYHPLLCHMMDVACVVEGMWDASLPQRWKDHVAEHIGLEPHLAQRWLMVLAGLHDVGKASPGFQMQLPGAAGKVVQRLLETGGFDATQRQWVPHALVSALAIQDCYKRSTLDPEVIKTIAMMLGGHHGIFPSAKEMRDPTCPLASIGRGQWEKIRSHLIAWLYSMLELDPAVAPGQIPAAVAMQISGLISVADWIASSADDFPPQIADATNPQPIDAAAYLAQSRQRAREALRSMGWLGWHAPDAPAPFTDLFPGRTPRRMQQTIIENAAHFTSPALVVIEAPMGEGKTEAALFLADRWCVADGGRGVFFALPTQATSTSMFTRVRGFLGQRFPADMVTLNLLHGHAALSEELQAMQRQGYHLLHAMAVYDDQDAAVQSDDAVTAGAVVANEWFASSKRALLAPFGVGTIDQGLMAALGVKHGFVRHLGLSTKTVLIDEVHSYDVYMTTLLKRLIEWLGAHRIPVVLLSATLPSQRRQELLAAYACGAGWMSSDESVIATPYPRVSWVTEKGKNS